MKGLKKGLYVLSLTFVLSACGTSASSSTLSGNTSGSEAKTTLDWNDYKNYGGGIKVESEKFKNYDLTFDKEAWEAAKKAADDAAVNQNLREFNEQTNKVFDIFSTVKGKVTISRARYYASGASSDKKVYEDFYDIYLGFYSWYYSFLLHVNESSAAIRETFFEDMSEQEIEEYIQGFYYTEETKAIDTEITAIQDAQQERYNKFGKDAGNAKTVSAYKNAMDKYISDSLNNFRTLLEKGNQYAAFYGFDNYLDYTYSEYYNRNYTCDFVEEYAPLIEEYVMPLIEAYEKSGSSEVLSDPRLLENFLEKNFCYESSFQGDAIDAYMERIGGTMAAAYDHFKKEGYYCFSTNSKSMGTAYVTSVSDGEPMIFFSSNYQTAKTFIHEFGHYTAAFAGNHTFPYDIEETHSQANEMLFVKYLQDYYKDSKNLDVYQFAAHKSAYEMLTNIQITFATAEVETYVFKNIDKKNSDIQEGMEAIWGKYYEPYRGDGIVFYDSLYYPCTPMVSGTGYYISYATSGVASLAVYVQACENFDTAKTNYLKLINYPEDSKDINAFFEYSGLYSPLEESTFQKLENIFSL